MQLVSSPHRPGHFDRTKGLSAVDTFEVRPADFESIDGWEKNGGMEEIPAPIDVDLHKNV